MSAYANILTFVKDISCLTVCNHSPFPCYSCLCRKMELPNMASLQLSDSNNSVMSSCGEEDVSAANVAVMNIADVDTSSSVVDPCLLSQITPRTLRKRLGVPLPDCTKKAKISLKRTDNLTSEKEMRDYYTKVNKKCNVKQSNLETIFEEPMESKDGKVLMMSGSKFRRSLVFSGRLTKAKKVKRSAKVKKFQLSKGKAIGEKKRKLTIDEVKMRLAESLDSWNELFECSEV